MALSASVLTALVAVELLAALVLAVTFAKRSTDREYAVAALFCAASAEHAWGLAIQSRTSSTGALAAADRLAWLGLLAAVPLAVHFSLVFRGDRRGLKWAAGPYAFAAMLALLDASGIVHGRRLAPHAPLGATVCACTALAACVVLFLMFRARAAGVQGSSSIGIGASVLLATASYDTGAALGAFTGGPLIDLGFAAIAIAILTTPIARYSSLSEELQRRSEDLRTRTNELRRSYEDLKTAQDELLKKEQLAMVGELAAVIAHEVRNPLAIIANAVAGLRKQAISREDHETLLGILEEETSRLNRLVTDLLRYARPVNLQRSHFSLADLLERALGLAKTKRSTIKMELKRESQEADTWGDPNLLRQVFDNLIDNAVQAMGSGGTLTVRLRLATQQGISGVAVDISDTGEGMDTQVRSRARDPFFTTRPSGTGLGLAIVDRIVDAHGGQLAIDSRAGEGTTVTVFLPQGSANEPPARGRLSRHTPVPSGPSRATG